MGHLHPVIETTEIESNAKTVTVKAGGAGTKTAITQEGDNFSFTWTKGDKLAVIEAGKEADGFRVTVLETPYGPYFTAPRFALGSHTKIEVTEKRAAEIAQIAYDLVMRKIEEIEAQRAQ